MVSLCVVRAKTQQRVNSLNKVVLQMICLAWNILAMLYFHFQSLTALFFFFFSIMYSKGESKLWIRLSCETLIFRWWIFLVMLTQKYYIRDECFTQWACLGDMRSSGPQGLFADHSTRVWVPVRFGSSHQPGLNWFWGAGQWERLWEHRISPSCWGSMAAPAPQHPRPPPFPSPSPCWHWRWNSERIPEGGLFFNKGGNNFIAQY